MKFNLPTLFPIVDLIPAPIPTGDWGAELCGSFVSRTLQWQLRFDRLTTPVISKGVSSFFSAMTQLNYESTTGASLPSILSTERTNGEIFPLVVTVLNVLVLF